MLMAPDAAPRISVIIGAFSRQRYLLDAVASVVGQTVPRRDVEILVTKNFRSPEIDSVLDAQGIRSRFDEEPRIGRWWLNAIRGTRAPLIAFLDDDDQFEPDRLARVLEVFAAHPHVGYYRNRISVIDEQGKGVPMDRWAPHQIDEALDHGGPIEVAPDEKVLRLPELRGFRGAFNNSTIVIRRELISDRLAARMEEMAAVDKFYFAAGVLSVYALHFDDRRSTRYREHPHAAGWGIRTLRDGVLDAHRLADLCRESGMLEYAASFDLSARYIEKSLYARTIREMIVTGSTRRKLARMAGSYLRFLSNYPRWGSGDAEARRGIAEALTGVLSPSLAQRWESRIGA
jgi:glycosyltransferase involved in cell wall biosynthesis